MPTITKLGKYLIRRTLGKGAMGIVYEGFDPVLARTVAIKTVLPAQLDASEMDSVLARFKREAQAAGRLNHPGIVAVYEYGEVDAEVDAEGDHTLVAKADQIDPLAQRVAFIAMQFVKGRELRSYFDGDERFSLKHVGRIMVEILEALDHAHSHGVIHRDIKPSNLILLENGRVKIADFGIARIESSQLTVAGTVMGTPSYMSPEQFQGHTVDFRSDLFSCGVILYQFLTGEKPFVGTLTSIMFKVLREQPVPPSALNSALNHHWDAVVDKAMAKSPDDRFQSASAFAGAIRDLLAQQVPSPVQAETEVQISNGPAPTATPTPQTELPAPMPVSAPSPALPTAPMLARAVAPAPAPAEDATFLNQANVSKAIAKAKKDSEDTKLAKATLPSTVSAVRKIPAVPSAHKADVSRSASAKLWPVAAVLLLIAAGALYMGLRGAAQEIAPSAETGSRVETSRPALIEPPPTPLPTPAPALAPAPATAPEPPPAPAPVPPPTEPKPEPIIDPPAPVMTQPAANATAMPPLRKTAPPPAAPARPVNTKPEKERSASEKPSTRPARCALILQKAAVSEPISAEERNFLTSSCQ